MLSRRASALMGRIVVVLLTFALLPGCAAVPPAATPTEMPPPTEREIEPTPESVATLTRDQSPVPLGEIQTRGPEGEVPVWYTEVDVTDEELRQIRDGGYTAAFLNPATSPFMQAIVDGSTKAFEDMGIELVAVTSSEFDPALQARDVENVLPLEPDIVISLAIDPVGAAAAFRPLVEQGSSLVFLSNKPAGYVAGQDFVGTVTYDIYGLGRVTAEAMCDYLDGEGKAGFIFFDAEFYITNQREDAFLEVLGEQCPDVEVVARAGISDPNVDGERVAAAMLLQHPEIEAIFAPWDVPAEGVVAALRDTGRDDIKVFTIDLGATNLLDMARDGNVYEVTSTLAFEFGYTGAIVGAYGILNKPAPEFVIVPVFPVTKDNLSAGWEMTFKTPLPDSIAEALGQ